MPAIPFPIPAPLIVGNRHSFKSIEARFNGLKIGVGMESLSYGRKRSRTMVPGTHPDPVGKTRGKNEYTAKCSLLLAEWNNLQASLGIFGIGYGDVPFILAVTRGELGMVTVTDLLLGCTIDSNEVDESEGTDATEIELDLNPVKILFNGVDDCIVPLTLAALPI